jgi:uncharacterized protein (DUF3084 family)
LDAVKQERDTAREERDATSETRAELQRSYESEVAELRSALDEAKRRIEELEDSEQRYVDRVIHYRNLAILLGAKPKDMTNKYDADLAECGDSENVIRDMVVSVRECWDEAEELEKERDAAQQRIAELTTQANAGWHEAIQLRAELSAAQQRIALATEATEQFKNGLHHFAYMQISSALNGYDAGHRRVVPAVPEPAETRTTEYGALWAHISGGVIRSQGPDRSFDSTHRRYVTAWELLPVVTADEETTGE